MRLTFDMIRPTSLPDWEEHIYETDGVSAKAIERRRFNAKEAAFEGLAALIGPGLLATFAAGGMVIAMVCVRIATRMGRGPDTPA